MIRMKILGISTLLLAGLWSVAPASASETITYTYDARGRLVKVERAGTVNDGAKTEYEHDHAHNRKRAKTTGA